ncbi:MAG: NfeD family protein [Bacillota bacterium]|nr:NfeD family protein [Bacillota bacterium]
MKKFLIIFLASLCFIFSAQWVLAAQEGSSQEANVYVVTLNDTIDNGAAALIEKAVKESNMAMADLLIVEINTYGGYIDSAITIKDAILSAPLPTVTFVNKQALSAGSLIAVAGEKLYMSPGSTIGAAEARQGEEKADEKTMSAWVSELRSTAEARGKNPDIMAAMADDTIEIDGLTEAGRLVTLSDAQALEYGISDATCNNYQEVAVAMGVEEPSFAAVEATGAEKFAAFVTNPLVSGVLIAVGVVGLLIAIATGSLGVSCILGICSLVLYFAGHMVVDSSGWVAVLLFVAGIVLICIEAFVAPGFGLPGIAGIAGLIGGICLLAESWQTAAISITVALVLSCILVGISMKNKKTKNIWRKFVLHDKTDAESGYTSPNMDNISYMGKSGVTLTPLRPAGQVDIEGDRVDVVTEGDFLDAGVDVVVTAVDGTRIVVKRRKTE